MSRRVVVTGIGLLTPLGVNSVLSWEGIKAGRSGIKKISTFDVSKMPCQIAGVIDLGIGGFNPEDFIELRDIRKMDKFIQYGIAAAVQAIEDSGWEPKDQENLDRTGVLIGSGIGGLQTIEDTAITFFKTGKVSPYFIPAALINLASGHISMKYGFSGPNHAIVTACASGTNAIGDAVRIIKYGDADVMVAGGAESPITPIGLAGFASARTLSTGYNDTPELASRPWDKDRDGFVMGEGSGIVVLEEYEHAVRRGAKIYAEIIGYGLTGDAYHFTAPHPEGRGAYRAMLNAINDAKINVEQIDYINAHGTSTPIGDPVELDAVQRLFLERHPKVLMSSTKSAIGHLLGAAGSVELIFSILAIRDQVVPPTLNLHNPIPEVKIDLVPLKAKEAKLNCVMSNSFGFGGTNASLVIKKV